MWFTGAFAHGLFVRFHTHTTLRRHRKQYEFEEEALKWLDRRHLEEAEGGL